MTSPIIMPGLHPGLSREEYDAIEAVNQSSLKVLIERTPAHYRWSKANPEPPSDALRFGNLVHLACYEPARFASDVVMMPKFDRRTKIGKEDAAAWEAENAAKVAIDEDEYRLLGAIQMAVSEHPDAAKLIGKPGAREATVVWDDEATGIRCKARMDQVVAGNRGIIDLKTSRDTRDFALEGDNRKYGYDVQAAFYCDGLAAATGCEPPPVVLIYVDKEWVDKIGPDAVVCHEMSPAAVALGRKLYREALTTLADCRKTGKWSGFTRGLTPIGVPNWALNVHQVEWSEELQEVSA